MFQQLLITLPEIGITRAEEISVRNKNSRLWSSDYRNTQSQNDKNVAFDGVLIYFLIIKKKDYL